LPPFPPQTCSQAVPTAVSSIFGKAGARTTISRWRLPHTMTSNTGKAAGFLDIIQKDTLKMPVCSQTTKKLHGWQTHNPDI
jgi:hypothetical protein